MTRFFLERPVVNPSLGSLTLMEIVETVLFFYQTNSPNLLSCFYQRTQGIIDQRLEAAEGIRQELRRVDKVALCLTPIYFFRWPRNFRTLVRTLLRRTSHPVCPGLNLRSILYLSIPGQVQRWGVLLSRRRGTAKALRS
jgi:hypothetical protein